MSDWESGQRFLTSKVREGHFVFTSDGRPDGLMSYSLPDGHQMIYRGLDVYFNDSVYDGAVAERSELAATSINKNINCGS